MSAAFSKKPGKEGWINYLVSNVRVSPAQNRRY